MFLCRWSVTRPIAMTSFIIVLVMLGINSYRKLSIAPEADLAKVLQNREFTVKVHLNQGSGEYWVWTSDVSYEYVKINAEYHT